MRKYPSSNTAQITLGFVSFAFWLSVAVLVVVAAVFLNRALHGNLHYGVAAGIDPRHLGRLPRHVSTDSDLPVIFDALHPAGGLVALTVMRFGLFSAAGLVATWMLRGVMKTARDGDPFVSANVVRLRVIGFVLLLYPPLSSLTHAMLESMYIQRSTAAIRHLLEPRALEINFALLLAGLGVLVIAQVFASGIELRTDLEGTI